MERRCYFIYLFSGDPPFNSASDPAIYTKIVEMKFSFPEKNGKKLQMVQKYLITNMLVE